MARISSTLRACVLLGLLAAASAEAGPSPTPTPRPLRRRSPQADDDHSGRESDPASITAVSDCHAHGSALFCMAGTAEYEVHTTVTATQDIPPAFTGCHSHGTETLCIGPDGEEVELHPVAEEDEEGEDHDHGSEGQHCHFHAGVEHCVGGSEEETEHSCERVERDYNIRLRVGLLFVMLVTSSIGVFTPILVASYVSPSHPLFTILRQFGTGVIISTAFVHLYTHANLMFQNECLGELAYESTAAAILMAGIFLSFLVEYGGNRLIQWHESKARGGSIEAGAHADATARTDMVNITVLEAGVIFHSLLIGLTLVVAGDSFFLTLFAVIVFHQMFEGLALGTRTRRPRPALARPPPRSRPGTGTARSSSSSSTSSSSSGGGGGGVNGQAGGGTASLGKKLLLAGGFALVTPVGMAIGIGALRQFNGNDPATVAAIGTLDALSAGILVWVGVVEMWAHDWMLGGEMTRAGPARTLLGLGALVVGMALMSLLGKWA
ncbi:hypothetical protein VTH06DRAFT_2369 [Thermothelomyces fergusii]